MKNLKDLTEKECIHIASIIEPDAKWEMVNLSKDLKWDGFDLIDKWDPKNIVQIDYREDKNFKRFRLYVDLCEYDVSKEKIEIIIDYLQSL